MELSLYRDVGNRSKLNSKGVSLEQQWHYEPVLHTRGLHPWSGFSEQSTEELTLVLTSNGFQTNFRVNLLPIQNIL